MRRADDIGVAEQRISGCRFVHEHVESGARHMAAIEKRAQAFSSTSPPRAQLMIRTPLLGLGKIFRRQNILCLRRQRRVQGNEIGAAEQCFEIDFLDPEIERAFRREIGIDRR